MRAFLYMVAAIPVAFSLNLLAAAQNAAEAQDAFNAGRDSGERAIGAESAQICASYAEAYQKTLLAEAETDGTPIWPDGFVQQLYPSLRDPVGIGFDAEYWDGEAERRYQQEDGDDTSRSLQDMSDFGRGARNDIERALGQVEDADTPRYVFFSVLGACSASGS